MLLQPSLGCSILGFWYRHMHTKHLTNYPEIISWLSIILSTYYYFHYNLLLLYYYPKKFMKSALLQNSDFLTGRRDEIPLLIMIPIRSPTFSSFLVLLVCSRVIFLWCAVVIFAASRSFCASLPPPPSLSSARLSQKLKRRRAERGEKQLSILYFTQEKKKALPTAPFSFSLSTLLEELLFFCFFSTGSSNSRLLSSSSCFIVILYTTLWCGQIFLWRRGFFCSF